MASKPLFDLNLIDTGKILVPITEIRKIIPQRHEFEQLSGITLIDKEINIIIGFKDVSSSEFWIRGHIPGRPIFPGVLIIESAAQLCSYFYKVVLNDDPNRFLGYGGLEKVKFRGTVLPGDRLVLIAKNIELKSRRAIFETQGIVKEKIVFEGTIIGMPI